MISAFVAELHCGAGAVARIAAWEQVISAFVAELHCGASSLLVRLVVGAAIVAGAVISAFVAELHCGANLVDHAGQVAIVI